MHCVIAEVTAGFIGAPYRAMENMGPMVFTVGVIGVTELATDVVVSFSTVDGSISGKLSVLIILCFTVLFRVTIHL